MTVDWMQRMVQWIYDAVDLDPFKELSLSRSAGSSPVNQRQIAMDLISIELAERGVYYEEIPVRDTGLHEYVDMLFVLDAATELLLVTCKQREATVADILTIEACKQELLEYTRLGTPGTGLKRNNQYKYHYKDSTFSTSIVCTGITAEAMQIAKEFNCMIIRIRPELVGN